MSEVDSTRISAKKHGKSRTPEYKSYISAKARCNNPNDKRYHDYGGRGIEFRFETFEEFLAEVGYRWFHDDSLDRIDPDGHYEKGNVRWALRHVQDRNRRDNRYLPNGLVMTDTSRKLGLCDSTIRTRIDRLGWCEECAMTLPKKLGGHGGCPHRA